jgi:hypothetical protein
MRKIFTPADLHADTGQHVIQRLTGLHAIIGTGEARGAR